jgi:predicted metal-dependent phosphoesterase TrpH
MHIHTCYSDGDFEPEEIVEKVKKAGINVFSITDHDTILGCKKLENFKQAGLTYIPGIELTASVPKGRMHILGYNLDINNKKLLDLLKRKRENSINSMEIMYRYVHDKYGVNIPQYEFDILKKKIGNIGRPDLALLLRKYGYAMDNDQAFKKYLVEAFDATYTNRVTTSKEECIAVLKDAGAYISLAHPISLKMEYEELKSELEYLKVLGLDAIEISHSNQPEEYRNILRYLRDELKLYETGGSDFHGPTVQPDIELGTGRGNNIKIKQLSLIDKIKS